MTLNARKYYPRKRPCRNFIANTFLKIFAKAFCAAYSLDSAVKAEIDALPNPFALRIRTPDGSASVLIIKNDNLLRHVKKSAAPDTVDLDVIFRSYRALYRVLLARNSISSAFCANQLAISGSASQAAVLTRVINIVQTYLYPRFVMSKILDKVPEKELPAYKVISKALFTRNKKEHINGK